MDDLLEVLAIFGAIGLGIYLVVTQAPVAAVALVELYALKKLYDSVFTQKRIFATESRDVQYWQLLKFCLGIVGVNSGLLLFIMIKLPASDLGAQISVGAMLGGMVAAGVTAWLTHKRYLQIYETSQYWKYLEMYREEAPKYTPDQTYLSGWLGLMYDEMARHEFRSIDLPEIPPYTMLDYEALTKWRVAFGPAARNRAFMRHLVTFYGRACDHADSVVGPLLEKAEKGDQFLQVHLADSIPNMGHIVTHLLNPFFLDEEAKKLGVGDWVRNIYRKNQYEVSLEKLSASEISRGKVVFAGQFDGSPQELVERYLDGLPIQKIFERMVDFSIPRHLRSEHGVIVAGSGGGKSQLIEALVMQDLAAADPPGIVLIDSKGGEDGLVARIAHLACFHPDHGRLRDRLIIIDPKDKPSLNMFDVPEEQIPHAIDSLRYFFDALLDNQLSGQMNVVFTPLMHIMLRHRGATLQTMTNAIADLGQYHAEIERIPQGARHFLQNFYNDKSNTYGATKSAIITRLSQIAIENRLDDMFGAVRNTVNLYEEINRGAIILISTANLGQVGSLFGRYFIAALDTAAQSRADMPQSARVPVHLYVDEAKQYMDERFAGMFNTLRSFNVGIMAAFQDTGQMGLFEPTIRQSAATKFIGSVEPSDAKSFASSMRTSPEFIMEQRKGPGRPPKYTKFAAYHPELPKAVSVTVPILQLDKQPLLSKEDYMRLRARNKQRLTGYPSPETMAYVPDIFVPGLVLGESEPVDSYVDADGEDVVVTGRLIEKPKTEPMEENNWGDVV